MKRVLVMGSGGAGKSTFSRRLGDLIGIELIHLDQLYWLPKWNKPSDEEWISILRNCLDKESWIMDGNYSGTREMRLAACDTVVFLDMPRRLCIYRILKRALIYRGRTRPDMARECEERFDRTFLLWVWNYRRRTRPKILALLENAEANKNVVWLRSKLEVERFLKRLDKYSGLVDGKAV